ncbi:hypothetical protein MW887_000701 [Aspergillus wentii]|nr:hypothetical protein MW887_000701 [Aspergillus wentii]
MTSLVVRTQNGSPTLIPETLPLPEPQSHQALIRVTHVAQNPNDVQSFDSNAFGDGTVLGCDFVGQVIKIGDAVTKIKSGDTIAGEFKGLGAYSEYILADESICFPISTGISLEQASTVPLAALTSWLAVLSPGCLNIDRNLGSEITLLIWGGSSNANHQPASASTLSNSHPSSTSKSSPPARQLDLVRSLGAHHVFDYRDEPVIDQITSLPNLTPGYIFDTIESSTSSVLASQTLRSVNGGGVLCTVRPGKAHTENVSSQTKVTNAFLAEHRQKEDAVWQMSALC